MDLEIRGPGGEVVQGLCPVCREEQTPLAPVLDRDLLTLVESNAPGWHPAMGLCRGCETRFAEARAFLNTHAARMTLGARAILPVALRLGAAQEYRGRGVTIAFLDAGFYAHPDLVEGDDRILRYVDVTSHRARREDLDRPDESSWHGMMTSVVACGNGHLSSGFYRGLASEARLVLVKCGSVRRILHDDIRKGLEWVIRHRKRYGVRVINVSCGGDYPASYLKDALSEAAEEATRQGMLVCAAVGNLGSVPGHPVLPPASAPSVLTVGGVDDQNRLAFSGYAMYHSSYGPTLDGLQKPEVIAPGIWVAAPILPGTTTKAQAELLSQLAAAGDDELHSIIRDHSGVDQSLDAGRELAPSLLRELVAAQLKDASVISGSYKHVDGTSFSAPIVTSIAAQMFEANPRLSPQEAKSILIRTARRLPRVEVDRQGWGVVDPKRAVLLALHSRGGLLEEEK